MPDPVSPNPDLTQYFLDLYRPFDPGVERTYDPVDLVRFALQSPTEHWPGLALDWLTQGVPATGLVDDLGAFEHERHRPQRQRHLAKRLRKAAQAQP